MYTIHIDKNTSTYNGDDTISLDCGISELLNEISLLWFYHPNIKIKVYNPNINDFIPEDTLKTFLLGYANSLEVSAKIIRENLQ